jgi:hypothetical protein
LHSAQTQRCIDRFDAKKMTRSFVEKLASIIAPTASDRACGADGPAQKSHVDSTARRP